MHNILLIAKRDYIAAVRTKAFLIGLIVAPLLLGGGFLSVALLKGKPDNRVRHVAIVDRTGVAAQAVIEQFRQQKAAPRYELEKIEPDAQNPDTQRLHLSDRVREESLFAFVEIGPEGFAWYSNEGGFNTAQRTVSGPLNDGFRRARMERLGIDPGHLNEVLDPVPLKDMSLVSKDVKTGRIVEARTRGKLEALAAPFIFAMLLGMIALSISGPMLSRVAEDKMQRVFEMLLVTATPFDLMAGKTLAATCIAFTSAGFYIVVALAALASLSAVGLAPLGLLPWFFIYLAAEIIVLSAFATALGTACGSPNDAENLKLLVVTPVMIPLFMMVFMLQQPNGTIGTVASFVPLFTPLLMLMRQASPAGVPMWQPYVGLIGVGIATVVISWISSRIFRIAILSQGKTPSFSELVRWGFRS